MINKINHKCKIVDGKILPSDIGRFKNDLERFNGKEVGITIDSWKKIRTNKQNNALHLYFELLSTELNLSGQEIKRIINVDVPWTGELVKSIIWKPIQKTQLKKKSTTQLTTDEIDVIYDIINREIGEKCGIHIPFPNIEHLFGEF